MTRFSTHFAQLHGMLPYPLLVMCREHEEMSHFGNRTCRKPQFWSSVMHNMKDSSALEFHGLFTENFQAVSKFGKSTQCLSLDTQEVNVILHLWLLVPRGLQLARNLVHLS